MHRAFTRAFIPHGARAASTSVNATAAPTDPIATAAGLICIACAVNCVWPSSSDAAVAAQRSKSREAMRKARMERTAKWREWFEARPQGARDEAQDFLVRNAFENREVEQWVRNWRYQYFGRLGRIPISDRTALVNFNKVDDLKERNDAIVAGATEAGFTLSGTPAVHPQLVTPAEGMMSWSAIATDSHSKPGSREELVSDAPTAARTELSSGGIPPAHVQRKDFFIFYKDQGGASKRL